MASFHTEMQAKGRLSAADLEALLARVEVEMTGEELQVLAENFLTSSAGLIELTQSLIGRQPRSRRTLFMKLWNRLDFYHRGYIKVQDLQNNFHSQFHPHVDQMRGYKQRADAQFLEREFRKSLEVFERVKGVLVNEKVFGVDRIGPGKLSEREFFQFCWFLSFENDSDSHFERMFYETFRLK